METRSVTGPVEAPVLGLLWAEETRGTAWACLCRTGPAEGEAPQETASPPGEGAARGRAGEQQELRDAWPAAASPPSLGAVRAGRHEAPSRGAARHISKHH